MGVQTRIRCGCGDLVIGDRPGSPKATPSPPESRQGFVPGPGGGAAKPGTPTFRTPVVWHAVAFAAVTDLFVKLEK